MFYPSSFRAIPLIKNKKSPDIKLKFDEQENCEIKWKCAYTALIWNGSLFAECNFCGEGFQSHEIRIFHNVFGYDYSIELTQKCHEIVDHLKICGKCKIKIPRGWFGCRCKKRR